MKFSNGYWRLKDNFKAIHPSLSYETEMKNNVLYVYAPGWVPVNRGNTVAAPVITLCLSAPAEGVLRVRIYHYKGKKQTGPEFELGGSDKQLLQTEETEGFITARSGPLSVRISRKNPWSLEFRENGRLLTAGSEKSIALLTDTDNNRTYMREELSLTVGETIYGLGERFTHFVKNGQAVDIWNEDPGTSYEMAYKNVPFYISSSGYGVFVNHPGRVSFEVGSEKVSAVQFSVEGRELDYYLFCGPTMKEVLQRYTALCGRPALPPAWSFGLWLTTSFVTDYDEQTVTATIDEMQQRELPLHVFHFDCFWMKAFNWCNFEWDRAVFPDPAGMLKRLKARGLKICVWINPYIAQASSLFDEAAANGYLLKHANGDIWQTDYWQAGMGYVDFTNPAAVQWYRSKLKVLVDMGVDCFKTDFGECIPVDDVVYYDRSDPERMHNYYTFLYNRTVFELLEELKGKGNAVLFARSATAGCQQFPVHWGGDCIALFSSMAESLRGGLSLALCGFGFWSHDIGGFSATAPAALYKRWVAFGLLSSHSRLHGESSYRVPWLFDEEAVEVLRFFTRLKGRLMPYIYSTACYAHETGIPVMRAMVLEFPGDPACRYLDTQYMLGDSLLVSPVFNAEGDACYYLPDGEWTNYFTDAVVQGNRWIKEKVDYMTIPLWVRPNSVLLTGSVEDKPDYDYEDNITLHLYRPAEQAEITGTLCQADGSPGFSWSCSRSGSTITLRLQNVRKTYSVLLHNITGVKAVRGGTQQEQGQGTLIKAERNAQEIHIEL